MKPLTFEAVKARALARVYERPQLITDHMWLVKYAERLEAALRQWMTDVQSPGYLECNPEDTKGYKMAVECFAAETSCEHEWEMIDEGGGGSEFQPPDPPARKCCLCGKRE